MVTSTPARFLLVEDDQSHADLIRMAFDDNNIANSLEHVDDGEKAIRYLKGEAEYASRQLPDIILLDVRLPKLDGHEVLRFIKSDEQLNVIPVVMLTTSDAEVDRTKAYQEHVNSYLTKPVDFDQFQKMIKDLEFYWAIWNSPPSVAVD
ncbi:MAG: response regulator [Planctomycetota bacterium]